MDMGQINRSGLDTVSSNKNLALFIWQLRQLSYKEIKAEDVALP